MSFKELKINHTYKSPENDVVTDFYIPVLKKSTKYYRVSGYFNSKSLSRYREGVHELVKNDGKMKFIISQEISEKDFIAIKQGYDLRETVFQEKLNDFDFSYILENEENHLLIRELIRKEALDVKVGFSPKGLFHSKFGLFFDQEGNIIHFSGSNNETYSGLMHNYEMFNVTTTWLSNEFDQGKIHSAKEEFELLWSGKSNRNIVYVKEFNEAVKNKMLKVISDRSETSTRKRSQFNVVEMKFLNFHPLIFFLDSQSLKSKTAFKESDFWYKYHLKSYFSEEGFPYTKENMSYMQVKKMIDLLKEYAHKHQFKFELSEDVITWLEEQDYKIEKRRKYGLMIKSQDSMIKEKFDYFQYVVSEEMERKLRPQQMISAYFMTEMNRTGNFSVPGSGKTSMVYGTFAYLNSPIKNKVDKIVMVGPINSFASWEEEFTLNFGEKKEARILNVHDKKLKNPEHELRSNSSFYNLILVNYESLPKYEEVLKEIIDERTLLVFDEVHRVKNPEGVQANSALAISYRPIYKIVLTGTPIPNGYVDIYNMLNILYTEEYDNYFNWDYKSLQSVSSNKANLINRKIYPFYWRTNKKELEVPPAEPDKIYRELMTAEEQKMFDMLHQKSFSNPLVKYVRLMQASSNPSILLQDIDLEGLEEIEVLEKKDLQDANKIKFSDEEKEIIEHVGKSSKYLSSLSLIQKLTKSGEKVIVWTVFVQTIQDLLYDLDEKGIKASSVYGDTQDKDNVINAFKNGDIQVLVTNPHTLGESVSLHHTCHHAIYLEYTFNLTHMLQSRDRIHRLGLKPNEKTYYHYFMLIDNKRDSIDEIIYTKLSDKQLIMEKAIDNDYLEPLPASDKSEIIKIFTNK